MFKGYSLIVFWIIPKCIKMFTYSHQKYTGNFCFCKHMFFDQVYFCDAFKIFSCMFNISRITSWMGCYKQVEMLVHGDFEMSFGLISCSKRDYHNEKPWKQPRMESTILVTDLLLLSTCPLIEEAFPVRQPESAGVKCGITVYHLPSPRPVGILWSCSSSRSS